MILLVQQISSGKGPKVVNINTTVSTSSKEEFFSAGWGTMWCSFGTSGPSISILDGSGLERKGERKRGESDRVIGEREFQFEPFNILLDGLDGLLGYHVQPTCYPKISLQ